MMPYSIEEAIWRSKLDTKAREWYHQDDVAEMYMEMKKRIEELEDEVKLMHEDAAGEGV